MLQQLHFLTANNSCTCFRDGVGNLYKINKHIYININYVVTTKKYYLSSFNYHKIFFLYSLVYFFQLLKYILKYKRRRSVFSYYHNIPCPERDHKLCTTIFLCIFPVEGIVCFTVKIHLFNQ